MYQNQNERVKVMCKNCDNETKALKDLLLSYLKENKPKSEEEEIREIMDEVNETKAKVVKSVAIDSSVTVHFLPGYSKHGNSVIKMVTELQRHYPAPGKVDVYFPGAVGLSGPQETARGTEQSQASTSRWSNGKLSFDGEDRVLFLSELVFLANQSSPGWHMPVYDNGLVNEGEYVITHEWGHVNDVRSYSKEHDQQLHNKMQSAGLLDFSGYMSPAFGNALSQYAFSSEPETYAESFTEWVVTNGTTNNFAARWYAKEYGWPTLPNGIRFAPRRKQHREAIDYRSYSNDGYRPYSQDDDYAYAY